METIHMFFGVKACACASCTWQLPYQQRLLLSFLEVDDVSYPASIFLHGVNFTIPVLFS